MNHLLQTLDRLYWSQQESHADALRLDDERKNWNRHCHYIKVSQVYIGKQWCETLKVRPTLAECANISLEGCQEMDKLMKNVQINSALHHAVLETTSVMWKRGDEVLEW